MDKTPISICNRTLPGDVQLLRAYGEVNMLPDIDAAISDIEDTIKKTVPDFDTLSDEAAEKIVTDIMIKEIVEGIDEVELSRR